MPGKSWGPGWGERLQLWSLDVGMNPQREGGDRAVVKEETP